jgi:uncharacterized RDD family membrane protein YckC
MQSPTKVVGQRVLAYLIDFAILAAVTVGAWFALTTQVPGKCPSDGGGFTIGDNCRGFVVGEQGNQTAWYLIVIATWFVLFVILPGLKGTSPGHSVLGLKIVNERGEKPGFWRGLGRGFFLWLIDVSIIGLIVALVTKRNQRVGDLVAGTFVVRKSHEGPVPAPDQVGAGPQQFAPTGGWNAAPTTGPAPQPPQGVAEQQKADWYPDPHGQARLRYWDGQRWTEHTSA